MNWNAFFQTEKHNWTAASNPKVLFTRAENVSLLEESNSYEDILLVKCEKIVKTQ